LREPNWVFSRMGYQIKRKCQKNSRHQSGVRDF
jgi:hypothetical protein